MLGPIQPVAPSILYLLRAEFKNKELILNYK